MRFATAHKDFAWTSAHDGYGTIAGDYRQRFAVSDLKSNSVLTSKSLWFFKEDLGVLIEGELLGHRVRLNAAPVRLRWCGQGITLFGGMNSGDVFSVSSDNTVTYSAAGGHHSSVSDIALSTDGNTHLASCANDGSITTWRIGTAVPERQVQLREVDEKPLSIAFLTPPSNGRCTLVVVGEDGMVFLVMADTLRRLGRIAQGKEFVHSASISADGRTIVALLIAKGGEARLETWRIVHA